MPVHRNMTDPWMVKKGAPARLVCNAQEIIGETQWSTDWKAVTCVACLTYCVACHWAAKDALRNIGLRPAPQHKLPPPAPFSIAFEQDAGLAAHSTRCVLCRRYHATARCPYGKGAFRSR